MPSSKSGNLRRRATSLFISLTFGVLAVTGILAFVSPFSIKVIGLHSLMGFLFIGIVGLHVINNLGPLKGYTRGKTLWVTLLTTASLTALFFLQPAPVKKLLGLSQNLGPALDRFEIKDDRLIYQYAPADHYLMELAVKAGASFDSQQPPAFAIWLENQGAYHIKTLHDPGEAQRPALPYWQFKVEGWEQAMKDAEQAEPIDVISSPTPNGSFDPADYILPADPETSTPYRLLIEINQPADANPAYADQPSLVYAVEIDQLDPKTFQILDLVGYPKREDVDGEEAWSLYYTDDSFSSALELIDSALLTIEREQP